MQAACHKGDSRSDVFEDEAVLLCAGRVLLIYGLL